METFSALLTICAGNSLITGEFPAQKPVTRSFDVSVICVWISGWVNNRKAGDLRRCRANYDVIVIHFKPYLVIGGWAIACGIAHRRMSLYLSGGKSTLVQLGSLQATSQYVAIWRPWVTVGEIMTSMNHNIDGFVWGNHYSSGPQCVQGSTSR